MNRYIFVLLTFICANCFAQNVLPSETERLKNAGLVNVRDLDSGIVVSLLYAGTENFTGKKLYGDLREAFLQEEAARKLVRAQKYLKGHNAEYKLIVYDAARTRQAQKIMWEYVKDTEMRNYVANPAKISMHSYGVAVDVSILDEYDRALDMGTIVDFLGSLAEPKNEAKYLSEGKLTQTQINNRELLRTVMKKAGFRGISNEWWHFEAFSRAEIQGKYTPID